MKVLIADDKAPMRDMLVQALSEKGYDVVQAADGEAAVAQARNGVDVVVTDLRMPGRDGIEVLKAVRADNPETEVIVMTGFGTVENAVEAMHLGAYDYILKPFSIDELELKIARALDKGKLSSQVQYLRERESDRAGDMIGDGPGMRRVKALIDKVAPSSAPVLVLGESGTGKELVAREIHRRSQRGGGPLIAVNCAALSEGVLESELFGHERGAYTGASSARKGRFELADGGTLFLDEIGELSPQVQVKLLRFLQEKEFERVGGARTIQVDVRIVAATHRDLKSLLAAGIFREDLYYRLNVISIPLPPLRERPEDVADLCHHFLARHGREIGKELTVPEDVIARLSSYPWPGNIRELQNVMERAVVLADHTELTLEDLPPDLWDVPAARAIGNPLSAVVPPEGGATDALGASPPGPDRPMDLTARLEALERAIIRETLERFRWNQTKAAAALGLKRSSLQYKLKKHGLLEDVE